MGQDIDTLLEAGSARTVQNPNNMKKILIVEDEQILNDIYSSELREEGYDTLEAFDGKTALSFIDMGDVNLVILDIKLPDMSGLTVLESLRKKSASLPVIICSAYDPVKTDYASKLNENTQYLVKPFRLEQLREKIRLMLDNTSS